MEAVLCPQHHSPCMLKTGVKPGPNLGRSFYICANGAERCTFVTEAKDVKLTTCERHGDSTVELQALQIKKKHPEKKIFFRCAQGKAEHMNWCGHRYVAEPSPEKTASTAVESPQFSPHGSNEATPDSIDKTQISPSSGTSEQLPLVRLTDSSSSHASQPGRTEPGCSPPPRPGSQPLPKPAPLASFADLRKHAPDRPLDTHYEGHGSPSFQGFRDPTPRKLPNTSARKILHEGESREHGASNENGEDSDDSVVIIEDDPSPNGKTNAMDKNTYRHDVSAVSSTKNTNQKIGGSDRELKTDSLDGQSSQLRPHNLASSLHLSSDNSQPKADQRLASATLHSTDQKAVPHSSVQPPPQIAHNSDKSANRPVTQTDKNVEVVKVSSHGPARNLSKNMAQHADLLQLLMQQTAIAQKVNMNALPDKGAKIYTKIDELSEQIAQLDLDITAGRKEIAEARKAAQGNVTAHQGAHVPSYKPTQTDGVKTASGQLLSGMRQMKITDHVQQLPNHVYQQMYAANPQALQLYGGRMTNARLREVTAVTTEAIQTLHEQLKACPDPSEECEDPKGLRVDLMIHQRQALRWLTWRETEKPPGGILADDMGLGKTLTLIAHTLLQKQRRLRNEKAGEKGASKDDWLSKKCGSDVVPSHATLIVCPASVIHQWEKEVQARCKRGQLSVLVYHGPNRETDIHKVAEYDIVLTTYALIGREVGVPESMKKDKAAQDRPVEDVSLEGEKQPMLLRIGWERIVLDEAHNIKNHKSLTAMSSCRLRAGSRWALTGTPIQNDLLDMYSLLRFLRCSPFDEYKVWKRQVDNRSEKGKQRLNMLIKTLLLRREKGQKTKEGKPLVPLPEKAIFTHELVLTGKEKQVYDKIFAKSRSIVAQYIQRHDETKGSQSVVSSSASSSVPPHVPQNSTGSSASLSSVHPSMTSHNPYSGGHAMNQAGPRPTENKRATGGQILLSLLRLRQCCGHLSLMKDAPDVDSLEADGLDLDIVQQMRDLAVDEETVTDEAQQEDPFDVSCPSSKVDVLLNKMRIIKSESQKDQPLKSVVVSQWTKMLDIIEHHLTEAGFRCTSIRGNIPPKKRSNIVETFNTDPKGPEVMLLSLQAGGVGLNLIGGNNLFLMDMHWNPALEAQAFDRVFRVGQKRDVVIHRFVCKGTVEEKIKTLQDAKLRLAANVLTGDGPSANKLTLTDLKLLFGLDQQSLAGFPQTSANFMGPQT